MGQGSSTFQVGKILSKLWKNFEKVLVQLKKIDEILKILP